MQQIQIGKINVPYEISSAPKRKTMALQINTFGELKIKTPPNKNQEDIHKFLDKKKNWIIKKLQTIKEQQKTPKTKEFFSGEKLLYNGRRYRLKVKNKDTKNLNFKLKQGKFVLETTKNTNEQNIRDEVTNWYIQKAKENLTPRIKKYSNELNVKIDNIKIKETKNNWGENRKNTIIINWRIIMAPTNIQDYIIVHELTHLKEGKHTTNFWNIVGTILPDYEKRIKWLKTNGNQLYF